MGTFGAHLLMLDDVTVGPLMPAELEYLTSSLQHFQQTTKGRTSRNLVQEDQKVLKKCSVEQLLSWNRTNDSSIFYHWNGSSAEIRIESDQWKTALVIPFKCLFQSHVSI